MKNNLKTFPKKYDATGKSKKTHKRERYSIREVDVWKRDFEAELQRTKTMTEYNLKKKVEHKITDEIINQFLEFETNTQDIFRVGYLIGRLEEKKEILGE